MGRERNSAPCHSTCSRIELLLCNCSICPREWQTVCGIIMKCVLSRIKYYGRRACQSMGGEVIHLCALLSSKSPPNLKPTDSCHVDLPPGLKMLLFNATSVNNTMFILDLILDKEADQACVTEIWLSEEGSLNLSLLCPPSSTAIKAQWLGSRVVMV